MKNQLGINAKIEELKKKLEFDEKAARIRYIKELNDFPRRPLEPSFLYELGNKHQHNQLKPLLEKLIEIVKVQAEFIDLVEFHDKDDIKNKVNELLSK